MYATMRARDFVTSDTDEGTIECTQDYQAQSAICFKTGWKVLIERARRGRFYITIENPFGTRHDSDLSEFSASAQQVSQTIAKVSTYKACTTAPINIF